MREIIERLITAFRVIFMARIIVIEVKDEPPGESVTIWSTINDDVAELDALEKTVILLKYESQKGAKLN